MTVRELFKFASAMQMTNMEVEDVIQHYMLFDGKSPIEYPVSTLKVQGGLFDGLLIECSVEDVMNLFDH